MKKCPVDNEPLQPAYTKQGVEIDVCSKCQGIWLDKDEIYHFTKVPTFLKTVISNGLANQKPSKRKSPISGEDMVELSLFDNKVMIDYCLQSEGIWLDKGELEEFPVDKGSIKVDVDKGVSDENSDSDQGLIRLPSLAISSTSVLFGMYSILTLVLILVVQFTGLSPLMALLIGFGIVLIQFLVSPFIMDLTLKWLYKMKWVEYKNLPVHLKDFIVNTCKKEEINCPKIGIIMDGSPQAFTYGHHPDDGRIVISQGLMELLTEEEVEAVVAHEIGHMVHWDMVVMTVVQLVPLVLYYIYRTLIRMGSDNRDKSDGVRYMIAIGAYILYIISEYIVLWLSRIREYYADRYAGKLTGKPENLASALVKIGYGLAGKAPSDSNKLKSSKNSKKDTSRSDAMIGLQPLSIFNEKHANILAISGYSSSAQKMGGEIDKQSLKDVAKWDLWNPWAGYYELHSTHPLIAKRIKMLSNLSKSMGRESYIEFTDKKPESYWDDFFVDMFIDRLPMFIFIGGIIFSFLNISVFNNINMYAGTNFIKPLGVFIALFGLSYLCKILYSYKSSEFVSMNIKSLLKKIKVSAVNPVPCVIKGTIIGRGVPGLIYSEDFVLQDETGIIYLDYRQPLGIFNFIFGLLRAAKYKNQEAEIVGWYRRAPVPYIEIKELHINNKKSTCYTYNLKVFWGILLMALGLFLLLAV